MHFLFGNRVVVCDVRNIIHTYGIIFCSGGYCNIHRHLKFVHNRFTMSRGFATTPKSSELTAVRLCEHGFDIEKIATFVHTDYNVNSHHYAHITYRYIYDMTLFKCQFTVKIIGSVSASISPADNNASAQ